ncbi:VTT domain-containing protein [bacterium]|nr:VTT domain-containing protein [bacterium]
MSEHPKASPEPAPEAPRASRLFAVAKLLLLAAIFALLASAAWRYNRPVGEIQAMLSVVPPLAGALGLVAIYALVTVAPVPARDVVKVAGALMFGGFGSTLLVTAGEIGAVVATFALGRLAKDAAERATAGRFPHLRERIANATWWQIALLRVFPATPYRFMNYVAPLTPIAFGPYVAGCLVGTLPRTAFFQYLFAGAAGAAIAGGFTSRHIAMGSLVFGSTLVAGWIVASKLKTRRETKIEDRRLKNED